VILGTTVAPLSVHFSPQIYATLGGPRPFLATMFAWVLLALGMPRSSALFSASLRILR